MKEESWKEVVGYEGLYKVSNSGDIKNKKGQLKKKRLDKDGYVCCSLYKDGKTKKVRIHRIVAEAFIPNPYNKPQVNHKNGIKTDNRISNLEWCTRSENELHAYRKGLAKNTYKQREKAREYCKENKIKSIVQLDLELNFIKKWKSAKEAEEMLGINRKNISQCVTGRNKSAGGYIWKTSEQFKAVEYKVGG